MKIHLTSVFVDDQAKALAFYTEKLGFVLKDDVPLGADRWLTVASAEDPDGVRFTQEPMAMGPVTTAVFDDTCGNLIQIAHVAG